MRIIIALCLLAVACADQSGYSYEGAASSDPALVYQSSQSEPAASNAAPSYAPQEPTGVDKEYYSFSANDDDFNEPAASQDAPNALKRTLNVIFIRNPENRALEEAAGNLARQAGAQRTAVYILNKETNIADLANKLNSARNQNSPKPEVHFVKYRTPADAANAQRAIQAQYDSLGGPSQSHNDVAPELNFASSAPAPSAYAAAPSAPSAAYLPASIFRRA